MKLTEKMIMGNFDRRSFGRGNDYQRNGQVVDAIRTDELIWGAVAGSQSEPYHVKLNWEDGEISSECSCPVGIGCKHAVALALEYVRQPGSFTDMDEVLSSLKQKSKKELLSLISDLLISNPSHIREIGFVIEKRESSEGRVNVNAVRERIDYILSGELDYYHMSHVADEFYDIYEMGEMLQKVSNWSGAAEVYLSIAEGIFKAYEDGADDSSGSLGGIANESVGSFCQCAEEFDDEKAKAILGRVVYLFAEEDYGLETGDMILSLVRGSNLSVIEKMVKERLNHLDESVRDPKSFSYGYNRRKLKKLLSEVYSKLGMKEKALEVLLSDPRTTEEFVDAARTLLGEKRFGEALDMLRRAPKGHSVNHLYFKVLDEMPEKDIDRYWNTLEAVEYAFRDQGPLSRYIEWDDYKHIRDIFLKADAVEGMISETARIIPGTETLARLYLYEGESEKAASVFKRNVKISGHTGMSIGALAWKLRKKDLAMDITRLAMTRGINLQSRGSASERKMIGELLKRTPKDDIPSLVSTFKMDQILLKFVVDKLVSIRPDIARTLLEKNIEHIEGDLIVRMIKKLGKRTPEDSISLEIIAFDSFSGRSHIYYGIMIDMLKAVKPCYLKIHGAEGWDEYLNSLKRRFKTRKKLMKMIEGMERDEEKEYL